MGKKLFSIGETSKLSHIPIKTLRYYDEIDLLKPFSVNHENGYRYYSHEQFFIISIIKELKLFNFSLKEIKEFLKRDDLSKIARLYHQKKEKINLKIDHLKKIEQRIENRFEAFSQCFETYNRKEDLDSYKVQLKVIPEREIVFIRYKSAFNLNIFSLRCIELHNLIEEHDFYIKSPFMSIFHDAYDSFDPKWADIEICGCIYKEENIHHSFTFLRTLPSSLYASIICKGSHEQSVDAYHFLKNWILNNNYQIKGPTIKLYIINEKLIKDSDSFASELQIPIEKKH